MNDQNNKTDIIEKYLDDQMKPDEKRRFEEDVLNDPEFKEEIKKHQLLIDGIRLHGRSQLLHKTKEWDAELGAVPKAETIHRAISPFRWYYMAAAIVIIIVSVAVIYSNLNTGFDRVVAAHYEPYSYIPDTQRSESTEPSAIDEVFRNYDRQEYAKVIDLVNDMEPSDKTEIFSFLQANAYQATGENTKAIHAFSEIANSDSMYATASKWYLALLYLSEKQPDRAMPLVEELMKSNTSFSPKANKLMKDLD
jgi:tetratricopeptide (TPR) repeat protein